MAVVPRERRLFTIGYAGYDPESFLRKLEEHEVQIVVDVRQNPISRKKGFSRSKLSEFLRQHGVEYRHMPELGVPRALRDRLRAGELDLMEYLSEFRTALERQQDALDAFEALAAAQRCCLLCLEHLPQECHRSVIADVLAERSGGKLKIAHI
jgi:uncharacterized protein (DUF488 family)